MLRPARIRLSSGVDELRPHAGAAGASAAEAAEVEAVCNHADLSTSCVSDKAFTH